MALGKDPYRPLSLSMGSLLMPGVQIRSRLSALARPVHNRPLRGAGVQSLLSQRSNHRRLRWYARRSSVVGNVRRRNRTTIRIQCVATDSVNICHCRRRLPQLARTRAIRLSSILWGWRKSCPRYDNIPRDTALIEAMAAHIHGMLVGCVVSDTCIRTRV